MAVEVIAEFCQNHNGDKELLSEMVHAASESGARVGKIQTIFADNLAYRPKFETGVQIDGEVRVIQRPYQPEYDRLKNLELDFDAHAAFVELCRKHGLTPMTTCFAREHISSIRQAGFSQIKVASYDCASYTLLRELKGEFDRLVVSTGASYDDEIVTAVGILDGCPHSLLHCVTIYPTPLDQVHLARMEFLRTLAGSVGFSDHSLVERDGIAAAKAAVYLGAETVERHFSILPATSTKDGPVSIGVPELEELVRFSGLSRSEQVDELDQRHPGWQECIGESRRQLTHEELLNRDYYRGRFASRRNGYGASNMIFNWEETLLNYE